MLRNYLRDDVVVVTDGFEREKVKGVVGWTDDEITTENESLKLVGIYLEITRWRRLIISKCE